MADFTIHDRDSAPEASRPLLEASEKRSGFLPNLHAVMAEAPGLLEGYQTLHRLFAESSLSKEEKTVVWQAINVEHACHYCVPAHTAIARGMKVDDAVSQALRDEAPLEDPKLEALRTFTLEVVRRRGELDDATVRAFLDAGFDKRQVLEVILGVAQKVMSNYVNHLAQTPLDPPFRALVWEKAERAA